VNLIARILLAFALILGAGEATPPRPETSACGCDPCPCGAPAPSPTSQRLPGQAQALAQPVAAKEESLAKVREGRREAKPFDGIGQAIASAPGTPGPDFAARGRDPDLGRHLARLGIFRI
jgi:hypothetical protein